MTVYRGFEGFFKVIMRADGKYLCSLPGETHQAEYRFLLIETTARKEKSTGEESERGGLCGEAEAFAFAFAL